MSALRSRYVAVVAVAVLMLAVPLFLITTNLRIVINSGWLYSSGFDRHDVVLLTGIEKPELMRIAREIKHYFNSSEEPLDVTAVVAGREQPLFKQREVLHMADVKGLVQGLGLWQQVSFYYMAGFFVVGLALWGRRSMIGRLTQGLMWGSALTGVLFVAAGLAALVDFETAFEQFHVIGFSNDLWQLNPATDNLIRIFPEGFFLDATLILAGLTLGQAAITGGIAGAYRWRRRRVERGEAR
ncbi:MAG: TIGR01906 family membrane protein [Chloroflexi bacterium]|nr:TIGR01906 family membrane protein [Chloroflexota bacterium]